MPSMKNIINTYNKKIMILQEHATVSGLTNNVLYKASITPKEENSKTKVYYCVSETAFKLRYANHKKSFNKIKYQTDTELSNEYWNIKLANKTSNILGNFGNP